MPASSEQCTYLIPPRRLGFQMVEKETQAGLGDEQTFEQRPRIGNSQIVLEQISTTSTTPKLLSIASGSTNVLPQHT